MLGASIRRTLRGWHYRPILADGSIHWEFNIEYVQVRFHIPPFPISSEPDTGHFDYHSFGAYADDMTSPQIQCKTAAYQSLIPIRIIGGETVVPNPDPSFQCPNGAESQPTPLFLLNVTRLADMSFIKMQGKDGMLEPISYVPDGTGAHHRHRHMKMDIF